MDSIWSLTVDEVEKCWEPTVHLHTLWTRAKTRTLWWRKKKWEMNWIQWSGSFHRRRQVHWVNIQVLCDRWQILRRLACIEHGKVCQIEFGVLVKSIAVMCFAGISFIYPPYLIEISPLTGLERPPQVQSREQSSRVAASKSEVGSWTWRGHIFRGMFSNDFVQDSLKEAVQSRLGGKRGLFMHLHLCIIYACYWWASQNRRCPRAQATIVVVGGS